MNLNMTKPTETQTKKKKVTKHDLTQKNKRKKSRHLNTMSKLAQIKTAVDNLHPKPGVNVNDAAFTSAVCGAFKNTLFMVHTGHAGRDKEGDSSSFVFILFIST